LNGTAPHVPCPHPPRPGQPGQGAPSRAHSCPYQLLPAAASRLTAWPSRAGSSSMAGPGGGGWSAAAVTCPTQALASLRWQPSRPAGGFQLGRLQPGFPRRTRAAALGVPQIRMRCEGLCAL